MDHYHDLFQCCGVETEYLQEWWKGLYNYISRGGDVESGIVSPNSSRFWDMTLIFAASQQELS